MRIRLRVKLRRRNRRDPELFDQEPGEFEVAGAFGDMWWEGVVCGDLDGRKVCEDEVATFRVGVLIRC